MDDPLNLTAALPSRYVVGIDLGTTNSAVCFVDTEQTPWQVHVFAVPQWVAPGQMDARETLPSFHYQPLDSEAAGQALRLPWQSQSHSYVVGALRANRACWPRAASWLRPSPGSVTRESIAPPSYCHGTRPPTSTACHRSKPARVSATHA